MTSDWQALAAFEGYTLVFDLDGTLVETAPDLMHALNHVLGLKGVAPVSLSDVRQMVGQGARRLIERGLLSGTGEAPAALVDELTPAFVDYYAAHIADESYPFESVVDLLDAARGHGLKLGICTNKYEGLARLLMDTLELSDRFGAAIVGGDTLPTRKPDPAPLFETVARAGGDPERSVMIGDSINDIQAAKAADMPSIAVSFGYTAIAPHELGAHAVIDHFLELPHALRRVLA